MLLEARNLKKHFQHSRVRAVDGVSFSINKGETLGLVGESGSGKSTLAKLILRLLDADGGGLYFEGQELGILKQSDLKDFRKKAQIVFQEPFLSLDPRMTIGGILKVPFLIHGHAPTPILDEKAVALLRLVELPPDLARRYPRELSGGECQRVAIARALSTEPQLIVCDEAVSSLDVLVQAQILDLLLKLQARTKVSYLFISHDRRVVRHMSDRILTLKDGRIVSE